MDNDKEKFEIIIKNINFDNAKGLSKIKVTDNTQSNLPFISSETDYTSLNTVYSWNEGNTVYAYVQTGDNKSPNKILVSFIPFGGLDITKTPHVSINKGDAIKEIDIMAQINKGLGDPSSLQNWRDVQNENDYRYISWSEDGYEIQVSFYQPEASVKYLSQINIETQLDASYLNWMELSCEYI